MKAILIDPNRREVSGIEVDPLKIKEAFGANALLLNAMIGWHKVLFYDFHASNKGQPPFLIQGLTQTICGKGLLFDRMQGQWPLASTLTVREAECLVKFSSRG